MNTFLSGWGCIPIKCYKRIAVFLFVVLFVSLTLTNADAETGLDLVPADAFGYAQLSNIYQIFEAVIESPEWEELSEIETTKIALTQMVLIGPMVQMITGLTWEEFVKIFGRQVTLVVLGISDNPDLALIFDVEGSRELAEDALDQLIILMASGEDIEIAPESEEYSGVKFNTLLTGDGNTIQYGFIDNFMILAMNKGFEPIVDVHQGKATSILGTPEYQEMINKIEPSGTAYAYVNLERTIPAIQAAEAAKKGEAVQPPEDEMEAAILKSAKALAVKLDLLGNTHEAYLRLNPQGPAMMFAPLLLRAHPKLASINLLPAINGAFVGLQIGDPTETWTQLTGLAAIMGHDLNGIADELEMQLGFNLKDDLLNALTGEIGLGISLPAEEVNLKDNPIDFAKFQPVIIIGVKDRDKFKAIPTQIASLVQMDRFASSTEKLGGIPRGILTVDAIFPGIALAPWYTFTEEFFVASTSYTQVAAIIKQLENPAPKLVDDFSVEPWILGYLNTGVVAEFLVQQDLGDDLDLPETAAAKLPNISPIQIAYGAEPEGVKLTLTTAPDQTWLSNVLNMLMVVAYAEMENQE